MPPRLRILEAFDELAGGGDLLIGQLRERALHRTDLGRVDADLALEAEAAGAAAVADEPLLVGELEVGAIDRRQHPGRPRRDHDAAAGVGELGGANGEIDPQRHREVPGPEDRRDRARGGSVEDVLTARNPARCLDEREQADAPRRHAGASLGRVEQCIDRGQGVRVLDLRDDHRGKVTAHDRRDVVLHPARLDRVDPHRHDLTGAVGGDRVARRRPRGRFLCVGDGVFEVDHDHVGVEGAEPCQLALVAARREQQGAHRLRVPVDHGGRHRSTDVSDPSRRRVQGAPAAGRALDLLQGGVREAVARPGAGAVVAPRGAGCAVAPGLSSACDGCTCEDRPALPRRGEDAPAARAAGAQPPVSLALHDVRVVAVEQYGAGPWGTLQLADLGAEVIKIEDPVVGGDVGRYVPPFQVEEDSLFFETFNRNKKSVSLDLRRDGAREVLEDLVRHSDALYSNLRGDQPSKLRLTYDDLREVNPRIVCVSLSGFGMTGPRAQEAGYDYVMQAMAGWMSLTGEPDGPPAKSGLSLVDLSSGYVSAIALLAGLHRARRDGVGCDADISLFETALHQLMYQATWTATGQYVPRRLRDSAHPSIVPFQAFQTADGWITIACAKQKFWERLCEVLDRAELVADQRFVDFAARDRNRDELLPILGAALLERTTAAWVAALTGAGVPNGPVLDVAEALAEPHVAERGDLVTIDHPRWGAVRQVASPIRLSGDAPPLRRAPHRGEHTDSVLRDVCGYEPDRIAQLRDAGVLGAPAIRGDR